MCDKKIHEANAVASRHERQFVSPFRPNQIEHSATKGSDWGNLMIKDD